MFSYLTNRIALFIPTLLLASMLTFGLSKLAGGDPVLDYLGSDPFGTVTDAPHLLRAENIYRRAAHKLSLDRPAFYFSFTSQAYPDTLHKILLKQRRETAEKLIAQYGNWPQIEAYLHSLRNMEIETRSLPDSLASAATPVNIPLQDLYIDYKNKTIENRLAEIGQVVFKNKKLAAFLGSPFNDLKNKYAAVISEATPGKLKIPAVRWHGTGNQYHIWISNFVKGNFGISTFDQRPVTAKLAPAIFWTLAVNISAILLAFLISVPLGVWSAARKGSRFDKTTTVGLFMLYSLPAFWIGTMLLIFFTTKEYGMPFFAGPGLGEVPSAAPWWEKLWSAMPHLFLPVICVTYPALAFITRQVRGSMVNVLGQEYIKTARAKGLSEKKVIWKHGFRNALSPIITMLASVFPAAIAGSVVIEVIFNIPGMGWLTYGAILQKDWPVVFAVMMLGSVLTVVGILVSDVLYAITDPRVRFGK